MECVMDFFLKIVEEKIREAMEKGEFDDLPGKGKPLAFDAAAVPEDKRLAYKVLKNAGCLPPELELKKEIVALRELISAIDDGAEKAEKTRELDFKLMRFGIMMKRPFNLDESPEYREKIIEKLPG